MGGCFIRRSRHYPYVLEENPGAATFCWRPSRKCEALRDTVALLVGPEGGWTDEERADFSQANWTPVSLGPSILRAETAAIAGLAIVSAAWLAEEDRGQRSEDRGQA